MKCLVSLLVLVVVAGGDCANVLAVLPFPSRSHSIFQHAVLRLLAVQGHRVLVFSPYAPPHPVDNLTHVPLPSRLLTTTKNWTFDEFMQNVKMDYIFGFRINGIWKMGLEICEEVFRNEEIEKLLRSEEKFDLVFTEATLGQESILAFGHRFKAPVINFHCFGTWSLVNRVSGNSLSISYLPESISFPFTHRMSLVERMKNFVSTAVTLLFYHYDNLPRHQRLLDRYLPSIGRPPLEDMVTDISLTFTNDHPTVGYPRPFTPNVVPVGGVHILSLLAPLPQSVKKFMDDGNEGVIFFSLGTIVPAHLLPEEYINAFIGAFRRLTHKVLWRINVDHLPDLPTNVLLTKWVPQPTVLAHLNCVLFLTHGGLFSQHEALNFGVPVVGIPFFSDQRYNVKFYEYLGVGLELEFTSITEESVYRALTTVLNNSSYKEAAEEVSKVYRDQPASGADSVVYWVDYVLRHGGADHLRPASAAMPWNQFALLDLFVVASVTCIVVLVTAYKVIKYFVLHCHTCIRVKLYKTE